MARKPRHVSPSDPDTLPRRKRSAIVGIGVGILAAGLVLSSLGPLAMLFDGAPAAEAPHDHEAHAADDARIKALETAAQSNPQNAAGLIALGNAYFDSGKFPQAAETYTKALALTPANPDVRVDMGTALFYQGKSQEAIAEYHRALSDAPEHLNAHMNLGIVYRAAGNNADAKAHWNKAISLTQDPELQKRLKTLIQSVGG
jgi:cytochrome c-type biogenesis protein CcmH/NrfG